MGLLQVAELRKRTDQLPDDYWVVLVGDMITEEALPTYMAMLNTLDGVRDETGAADTPWGRSALSVHRRRLICFAGGKIVLPRHALNRQKALDFAHQRILQKRYQRTVASGRCLKYATGAMWVVLKDCSKFEACTFIHQEQLESGMMHAGGLASGQQRRTGMATS